MPKVDLGGVTLNYEVFGAGNAAPAVLLHGLGNQLTSWPKPYVEALAKDRPVYAFDQRDRGLSTKLGPCLTPEFATDWDGATLYAQTHDTPYSLYDMASDIIRAISALKVPAYHIVGHSMGGMVAQIVAAQDQGRVLSLTSLASSGGQAEFSSIGAAKAGMSTYLTSYPSKEEAAAAIAAYSVEFFGDDVQVSEAEIRHQLLGDFERNYCPAGSLRQFWAVMSSGDRANLLKTIRCPVLAILGRSDTSIPPEIGRRLADLVPGARLEILDAMSHSLSDELAPTLVQLTQENFAHSH